MHALLRSCLLCSGLVLLVAPPMAVAQSRLPDPIAPAVIGRPLDEIRPARPAPQKPVAAKPAAARPTAATTQRAPKGAVDDRPDPRAVMGNVGEGTRLGRKPLGEGAYIGDRHRNAVRKYYEKHPASGAPAKWQVGEPVPAGAQVAAVPQALLARLPPLPPGHEYLQVGGDVVLVAAGSRMVVDGISRSAR